MLEIADYVIEYIHIYICIYIYISALRGFCDCRVITRKMQVMAKPAVV